MRARGAVGNTAISLSIAFGIWACSGGSPISVAQDTLNATASDSGNATRRISINVEVTDKSGHPVNGLEAADFKIFDNAHQQQILSFGAIDASHPAAIPPQFQIIIDAMNSGPVAVAQERDGVSAFLTQNSGKLDYATSIWALENEGLKQIAAASKDTATLLAALNGSRSPLRVIGRSAGAWGDVERTNQAIDVVKKMIAPVSRTPGRKLVLFVSPGWPLLFTYEPDRRNWLFDDIVEISNGLRESEMSLYTLAPSNFNTLTPYGSSSRSFSYEDFVKGITKISDAQYADLSLQVLSEHSGGVVMIEGNDIKAEIDTAVHDAGAYYTLSFERAPGHGRTEYHEIRVTVDRPRVKIRTTAGYYVKAP